MEKALLADRREMTNIVQLKQIDVRFDKGINTRRNITKLHIK